MENNILSFKSHYYFVKLLVKRKSHITKIARSWRPLGAFCISNRSSDFKSLIDAIYFKGLRTKLGIGILFWKLFLPTVRKNCSCDRGRSFEIWGWKTRICNIFEITRTFIWSPEHWPVYLVSISILTKYQYTDTYT